MDWLEVCPVADLDPEDVKPFVVGGVPIAVCIVEGECFAFADQCTHEAVSLSSGFLMGPEIECPLHGARFDVRNGRCLTPPATDDIAVFPVKVEQGILRVRVDTDPDRQQP
jgi:3-phenylpropionate/trans-cinnamate dioxygenase ferredoxin subunit